MTRHVLKTPTKTSNDKYFCSRRNMTPYNRLTSPQNPAWIRFTSDMYKKRFFLLKENL